MKQVIMESIRNPHLQQEYPVTQGDVKNAIDYVLSQLDKYMADFTDVFQSEASVNLMYKPSDNKTWTVTFYTAMLWLAYEITGDDKYRKVAEVHVDRMKDRADNRYHTETHDLGFLYTLSCVAAYKLTGNEEAKQTALKAADLLMERFFDKAGIIQAWGDLNNPAQRGRMIIDCNMNLPLLYWAHEVTGEQKYYDAAESHGLQAAKYIVRDDASTYHTFYMDVETGEPIKGTTHQGYSDDSCWSRGQGWGVYGFMLSYIYTKEPAFMELSQKLCNYYLNRLPDDFIACWDLDFTENDVQRDSSAASITACGILEMLKHLPVSDPYRKQYETALNATMKTLMSIYTTQGSESNGILLHGVYNFNNGAGVDECTAWGDYFYFEALVRMYKDWNLYW